MKIRLLCLTLIGFVWLVGSAFVTNEVETPATLGDWLFFDAILSRNRTVSCDTCHFPEYAFANTSAVGAGVFGRTNATRTRP